MRTVRLEPLAFRHAARLHTLAADPALAYWAGIPHPLPFWESYRWVEDALRAASSGSQASYAVIAPDGQVAGMCELTGIDPARHSAVLGFWLGKSYHGRGYGTAACRLAVALARSRFELHSLESRVLAGNLPSIALLRRLGFRLDGKLSAEMREPPGASAILEYRLADLQQRGEAL